MKLNFDVVASGIAAAVLVSLSWAVGILPVYNRLHINTVLIQTFGALLGLSLAAFGIVATLMPHLRKDLLKSSIMLKHIPWFFLSLIIAEVTVLILGLMIFSLNVTTISNLKNILIILQLFLVYLSLVLFIFGAVYVYTLFKIVIKEMK